MTGLNSLTSSLCIVTGLVTKGKGLSLGVCTVGVVHLQQMLDIAENLHRAVMAAWTAFQAIERPAYEKFDDRVGELVELLDANRRNVCESFNERAEELGCPQRLCP